jgi:hypothetical protein
MPSLSLFCLSTLFHNKFYNQLVEYLVPFLFILERHMIILQGLYTTCYIHANNDMVTSLLIKSKKEKKGVFIC